MRTHSIAFGVCVSSLLIGLLTQSPHLITLAQGSWPKDSSETFSANQQAESDPCDIAKSITVKVLAGGSWGSGILVQRQGRRYTVLTNAHVLLLGNSYQIQTPDGEIYPAKRLVEFDGNNTGGDDLAVLQFDSSENYRRGILARNPSLRAREEVLAAGFPVNTTLYQNSRSSKAVCLGPGGIISLILDRPMQEGYQIGYHIDIAKGMSGGPLLNEQGEVIGVNGKHSAPLIFSNPDLYVYKNGDRVQQPLQLMTSSSWAIPIETFVQLAPHSLQFNSGQLANAQSEGNRQTPPPAQEQSSPNEGVTAQNNSSEERKDNSQASQNPPTQAANPGTHVTPTLSESEIKNRAEKITILVSYSDKSSPDKIIPLGAGVLIAKQGTTYYALTHESVIPPHYYENQDSRFSIGDNQPRYEVNYIGRAHTGLVLLQFTSNQNDEVARVGDAKDLEENRTVYIAGWNMGQDQSWEFQFTKAEKISQRNFNTDYIVADNQKTVGMKGGPVIDEKGMLVAIHHKGKKGKNEGISIPDIQSLLPRQHEGRSANSAEPGRSRNIPEPGRSANSLEPGRSAITPPPRPRTITPPPPPSQPTTNSIQPPDPDGPPLPRCSETLWGECIQ